MYEKISKAMDLDRSFSDAFFEWDVKKIKEIFAPGNPTYPDINRELITAPAILIAALKQKWEMFELLYDLNADLDVKSISNGWHLIHECVKNAPLEITKGILEYCNLNVQTEDGRTPLMVAIASKNETLANMILDQQGLKLSLVDNKKNNAAHYAAQHGLNDIFLRLVKENIPLHKPNKDGKMPGDLLDDFFKESNPNFNLKTPVVEKEVLINENIPTPIENKPEIKPSLTGLSKIKKKF